MRPLLPRPGPPVAPPTFQSSTSDIAPIQKTLTACNECRHKKTKCDGERPNCSRCKRVGTTCVYASDSIIAQNVAKRKFKELQETSDSQVELINILRNRDQHAANVALQRLRAGESVDALVRFIKQGDLLLECRLTPPSQARYTFPIFQNIPPCLQSEETAFHRSVLFQRLFPDQAIPGASLQWRNMPNEKKYDLPYHTAELVERHLEKVRASQWTTVTESDDLVRALLRAYLYYDFPYNSLFHKDIFLGDLVTGRKTYCSSLLVNAILACACHCLRTPTSSTDFWPPKELIYQFTAEAKRLWEREQYRKHITTVQAGGIIGYSLSCDGLDRIGFQYLRDSILIAEDMGIFSAEGKSGDPQRQAVIAATSWGLFNMQARQTFHIRQPPLLVTPPPITWSPEQSHTYFGELQAQYPQTTQLSVMNHSLVFSAACALAVIVNNIVNRNYGIRKKFGSITFAEAMHFRDCLLDWQQSLPRELQIESVVFPVQLKLHLDFYTLLIVLFDRFNVSGDAVTRAGLSREEMSAAQSITSAAKTSLEAIIHLYYARHGFEKCDTAMFAYFDLIGFSSLKDLAEANGPARLAKLSTVVLCAKGLRDQARNFFIAEAVFAILRDSMSHEDARQLRRFAKIEDEEKRKRLLAEHVFSHYPLKTDDLHDVAEKNRLDELVKSYASLDLDGADAVGEFDDADGIDSVDEVDSTGRSTRMSSVNHRHETNGMNGFSGHSSAESDD